MPNIVGVAQPMTEKMPEIELDLGLKKFYKSQYVKDQINCLQTMT